jgi:hypothetical protein
LEQPTMCHAPRASGHEASVDAAVLESDRIYELRYSSFQLEHSSHQVLIGLCPILAGERLAALQTFHLSDRENVLIVADDVTSPQLASAFIPDALLSKPSIGSFEV